MPTAKKNISWPTALAPLLARYAGQKHPLVFRNRYELLVMVILSSRTSDRNVNAIAPEFFRRYPSISSLSTAQPEDLHPYVRTIPGFVKKAGWIVAIAREVKNDGAIPDSVDALTKLPGLGRKSANVIVSESGSPMAGVIVDLHVLRVAPRIGIAKSATPEKVEEELMRAMPQTTWRELGMSLTFLGRELCRPTDPSCGLCPVEGSCQYAQKQKAARRSAKKPRPVSRRRT